MKYVKLILLLSITPCINYTMEGKLQNNPPQEEGLIASAAAAVTCAAKVTAGFAGAAAAAAKDAARENLLQPDIRFESRLNREAPVSPNDTQDAFIALTDKFDALAEILERRTARSNIVTDHVKRTGLQIRLDQLLIREAVLNRIQTALDLERVNLQSSDTGRLIALLRRENRNTPPPSYSEHTEQQLLSSATEPIESPRTPSRPDSGYAISPRGI